MKAEQRAEAYRLEEETEGKQSYYSVVITVITAIILMLWVMLTLHFDNIIVIIIVIFASVLVYLFSNLHVIHTSNFTSIFFNFYV